MHIFNFHSLYRLNIGFLPKERGKRIVFLQKRRGKNNFTGEKPHKHCHSLQIKVKIKGAWHDVMKMALYFCDLPPKNLQCMSYEKNTGHVSVVLHPAQYSWVLLKVAKVIKLKKVWETAIAKGYIKEHDN